MSSFPLLANPLDTETRQERIVMPHTNHEFVVDIGGETSKPAIITYHDLGLNFRAIFQPFLHSSHASDLLANFCFYHVTAPGQEPHANDLPKDYVYPSMDELSTQVEHLVHYFGLTSFVGLGIGLGANVLARLAKRRPGMMDGLIAVNCCSQKASWIEWASIKINVGLLQHNQREKVTQHIIWHYLGKMDQTDRGAGRIAARFRSHLTSINERNLALLMDSYGRRTDLELRREVAHNGKPLFGATRSLKIPVLNMVGERSPCLDATITFNGRLQPNKCTWMKIEKCAMPIEEQKQIAARAIKLFLQGLGYHCKAK